MPSGANRPTGLNQQDGYEYGQQYHQSQAVERVSMSRVRPWPTFDQLPDAEPPGEEVGRHHAARVSSEALGAAEVLDQLARAKAQMNPRDPKIRDHFDRLIDNTMDGYGDRLNIVARGTDLAGHSEQVTIRRDTWR